MQKIILCCFGCLVCGCKQEAVAPTTPPLPFAEATTAIDSATYHTDTSCAYEYRTGTPGDYEYNYDVLGHDAAGQAVTGNVTMEDQYGTGTIRTAAGFEVVVEAEWVGYGLLKATDEKGNDYDLKVE